MKLRVLLDNTALEGFEAVHGFSLLIEADKKILFDFGPNDLFVKNAERLGEDLSDIDTVVLSHGHWDHGDGLKHISDKELILHPDCFRTRYRKRNETNVGLSLTREELMLKFKIHESRTPYWISESMVFLGEVPRTNDFESKSSPFLLPGGLADFVPDDSALVVKSPKGLIVISGCAHAGICNTVAYAKEVCKTDKVYAVLGGFHLKELDETTKKSISYLVGEKLEIIGPTHCTSFKVRDFFASHFKMIELAAGVEIEI